MADSTHLVDDALILVPFHDKETELRWLSWSASAHPWLSLPKGKGWSTVTDSAQAGRWWTTTTVSTHAGWRDPHSKPPSLDFFPPENCSREKEAPVHHCRWIC